MRSKAHREAYYQLRRRGEALLEVRPWMRSRGYEYRLDRDIGPRLMLKAWFDKAGDPHTEVIDLHG